MRGLPIVLVASAACGAAPPPSERPGEPAPAFAPPLGVAWQAAQADGDQVAISLVVDGKSFELGTLPAATESEAGTPATCALRAAHATRTEITCGDMSSSFAAELEGDALVLVRLDGTTRTELRRVEVYAGSLSVAPYRLPGPPAPTGP